MFLPRDIENVLKRYSKFPVVALMGPRQSGKTTLVKKFFASHKFISFEDPAMREFAETDPRGFLAEYENEYGLILDEFQYVPGILSYIQLEVDNKKRPGYFVITGSQNFLMNETVTQSLAGRVGILTLLPFSFHELKENGLLPKRALELIINGSYPRIYADAILPQDLYPSYIHTYIERDVRQLINVGDLRTFHRFLLLCAGRVGQLLNISDLAVHTGVSVPTAQKWLSVLQASYIIFLLFPHFNNFNKRLVKTPKLYFHDTGLVSSLLGMISTEMLFVSSFKGALFENLIMAEMQKQFYNQALPPSLYFWRDRNGRVEIDGIIDKGAELIPFEIKSSETLHNTHFFDGIRKWNEMAAGSFEHSYVIYAGEESQKRIQGNILSWEQIGTFIKERY